MHDMTEMGVRLQRRFKASLLLVAAVIIALTLIIAYTVTHQAGPNRTLPRPGSTIKVINP